MATGATMYDGALMWPTVYFWKTCGVFLADLSYNRYQTAFTALVFVSGVLNVAITPWSVCVLDGWCNDALSTSFRRLYTRMLACTSLMSRVALVYKARRYLASYKRNADAYEQRWPTGRSHRRWFRAYSASVVAVCLVLTVPINMMRLYMLYRYEESGSDVMLLLFFFNVYLQNWSMCCLETHFALLCFAVYLKFRAINDELSTVRTDVMVSNRYPVALRSSKTAAGSSRSQSPYALSALQDPQGRTLETAMEALRIRHGLNRESIDDLKNMFGAQLGLSLVALCVMMLFDIYNEAFHVRGTVSRSKFIYGWMLQYVFRFVVIVVTAHVTSQEGSRTKVLVTEINNRHLNRNTKYELQLFLKQMNHQTVEITAYDFFTLNNHLIASVIAVGTTYLFVLIQFHSDIL